MPISRSTGSLRVVRFLKRPLSREGARSDGDSRRRACFGRRGPSRTASGFPSSRSSAPRASSGRFVRSRPRSVRAPCLVKGRGLPDRGRLRSSVRDPWRGLVPASSATVDLESRHEVATHVCSASHVFATRRSCDRTTGLLSPLFARSRWIGALLEGREQPFAVAGSSAIGAPLFRELPPRIARAGR